MRKYKCKRCGKEYDNYDSLRKHTSRIHKISSEEFYLEFILNNKKPLCKCGCGEPTKWNKYGEGFRNYIKGHHNRVNNNFNTEKSKKKSIETRRKKFKNGEIKIWNKGLTKETSDIVAQLGEKSKKENNPERAKKISKKLKGIPKSKEHTKKNTKHWQKYWSDPKHREEQSHKRMIWMKENDYTVKSNLEIKINDILKLLNIKFEDQYYIRDIKAYYDFYLIDYNILIEIHGDFWHCNPLTEFKNPKYECQIKNLEKDKIKERWCDDNNIPLLKIWESEINDNIQSVTKNLLEFIEENRHKY